MRTRKPRILTIVFALILPVAAAIVLTGCATMGTANRDASIESSIRESSAFKTNLQNENVSVNADNGKVTLTGSVPDASYKFLAEDIAKDVAGVTDVDNKLEVAGGSPQKGSDAWLGAKVKAELMKHPDLNLENADVYVNKGVVTLRGQADTTAHSQLASEYAKNVKDVKDVVNEMTVASVAGVQPQASAQAVDDATITAEVNTALDANRSTRDLAVGVETNNGVVVIEGTADNQAQKDLVTRIVTDVAGVKGVQNEMSVDEEAGLVKETEGKISQ